MAAKKPKKPKPPPKPPKFKDKKAPPLFTLTGKFLEDVELYAGLNLTDRQIAGVLRLPYPVWETLVKDFPDIKLMLDSGRSATFVKVNVKLMEHIEKGNLDALKFWLRTQGKWREAGPNDAPEGGGERSPIPALSLTVNDPQEAARIYQQIITGS